MDRTIAIAHWHHRCFAFRMTRYLRRIGMMNANQRRGILLSVVVTGLTTGWNAFDYRRLLVCLIIRHRVPLRSIIRLLQNWKSGGLKRSVRFENLAILRTHSVADFGSYKGSMMTYSIPLSRSMRSPRWGTRSSRSGTNRNRMTTGRRIRTHGSASMYTTT